MIAGGEVEPQKEGADPLEVGDQFWLLVDHDNYRHWRLPVTTILQTWLPGIVDRVRGIPLVNLRAYGGWFEGSRTTDGRHEAAAFYQEACPSILRVGGRVVRVRFEFADSMLPLETDRTGDVIDVRNTLVGRASPDAWKAKHGAAKCEEADCELRLVRRWSRKRRACTRDACPHGFVDHFERWEQKQVDSHLLADALVAISLSANRQHVAVASSDVDVLPAIALCARLRSGGSTVSLVRTAQRPSYLDGTLIKLGVHICQADL